MARTSSWRTHRQRTPTSSSRRLWRAPRCTGPGVSAPDTAERFTAYLTRAAREDQASYLIRHRDCGGLVGYVNINNIVRGALRSGHLGYASFLSHARRGLMTAGLAAVVTDAFTSTRAAPARGQHPAGQRAVAEPGAAARLPARRLLAPVPDASTASGATTSGGPCSPRTGRASQARLRAEGAPERRAAATRAAAARSPRALGRPAASRRERQQRQADDAASPAWRPGLRSGCAHRDSRR